MSDWLFSLLQVFSTNLAHISCQFTKFPITKMSTTALNFYKRLATDRNAKLASLFFVDTLTLHSNKIKYLAKPIPSK